MMHILVQFPRLVVLIRQAIASPCDVVLLASAISLAEKLWQLTQANCFIDMLNSSISTVHPGWTVVDDIVDLLPYGLRFDCTENAIICTRYLLLQVLLCGTIDTIHRKFPTEYSLSHLPFPSILHQVDTNAAVQLAQVLPGLEDNASPLILIRLHGPLSASIGSWHRQVRYLSSRLDTPQKTASEMTDEAHELVRAERMKRWLLSRCNEVLKRLRISGVDERAWLEALDCMAGDEMPKWMPTKVSFGSERGEMIMKLEYSEHRATSPDDTSTPSGRTRVFNVRNPAKFGPQHLRDWIEGSETTATQ
jgi:hypothetical protein